MDWPTVSLIATGILAAMAFCFKYIPARDAGDHSGISHADLNEELQKVKTHLESRIDRLSDRIDQILIKKI